MIKGKRKKVLIAALVFFIAAAAGVFLYQDYYTLKEADLILFMGQSNMSGAGGDAAYAPELIRGAGYEYRAITDPQQLNILEEPFGVQEHREGYLDDRGLIERKGSLVTAFVNAYYKETRERVVAVSASRGSARISSFNHYLYEDALQRLEAAKKTMTEQGVNIRNIYMVWFQGETDAYVKTSKEAYIGGLQKLLWTLQPYGVSKCFVIQTGNAVMDGEQVDTAPVQNAQTQLCETDENFVLVSTLPKEISKSPYMEDEIHFTQEGLNLIGADAGRNMGAYVKKLEED
ncbi:MAG: sialate O-acetylesterase [Lachnospiraceae bacterium]